MFSFHVCPRLLKRKRQVQWELLLQIKWEHNARFRSRPFRFQIETGMAFETFKKQMMCPCLYPTIKPGPWKWWALHIDGGRHHPARSCYTRRLHTGEEWVSITHRVCLLIQAKLILISDSFQAHDQKNTLPVEHG